MCISVLRATFNPKTPQNFNRLEGKDEEMAANNSCYNWTRSTEVLGSRFWAVGVQAEGEEGSSASHVPSGNAHPSSNQKRSRSFRLDLQDIRWLMEVDGTGSDLWSRNLQRFQRTGLLLVEFKKKIKNQDFLPHSLKQRSRLLLRLGLGLLLCSQHPVDAPDGQVHLLLRVVVIKLTQVGY